MKAGDKVRSVLSCIIFDEDSHKLHGNEIRTFAQMVEISFEKWINKSLPWMVEHCYPESLQRKPGDQLVFWKTDKNRFTACLFLYTIIPYYKFKGVKKDKHGDLILRVLKCIIDGRAIDKQDLEDFDLQYYWCKEVSSYLSKIYELLEMSDKKFSILEDYEEWLNTGRNKCIIL